MQLSTGEDEKYQMPSISYRWHWWSQLLIKTRAEFFKNSDQTEKQLNSSKICISSTHPLENDSWSSNSSDPSDFKISSSSGTWTRHMAFLRYRNWNSPGIFWKLGKIMFPKPNCSFFLLQWPLTVLWCCCGAVSRRNSSTRRIAVLWSQDGVMNQLIQRICTKGEKSKTFLLVGEASIF